MLNKIAVYIRVSTEDQAKEGYSLEVQREYLETFAEREGHPHGFTDAKQNMGTCEVYKIYQDDGISGYSTERPAY